MRPEVSSPAVHEYEFSLVFVIVNSYVREAFTARADFPDIQDCHKMQRLGETDN